MEANKPRLFIIEGCPYCLKVLVFIADSNQSKDVVFKVVTDDDRAYVKDASGKDKVGFPALETSPKEIMFESMDIVNWFSDKAGLPVNDAVVFNFVVNSVIEPYGKLRRGVGANAKDIIAKVRAEAKPEETKEPEGPGLVSEAFGKCKLYVKNGCPFSARLLVFLAETRLLNQVELNYDTPENRAYIEEATGGKPRFPALELEPKVFKFDSGEIVEMCVARHSVDVSALTVYPQYVDGVFAKFTSLIRGVGHDEATKILQA